MLSALELCLLRIKRADTPTFKTLKAGLRWFMAANLPVPRIFKPSGPPVVRLAFFGTSAF